MANLTTDNLLLVICEALNPTNDYDAGTLSYPETPAATASEISAHDDTIPYLEYDNDWTQKMASFVVDDIDDFADAGADIITFHIESDSDAAQTIAKIKSRGCKAGLVLKPKTPACAVFPYLENLDLVLVMTVEPGFGGQSFMADMMPKVRELKAEIQRRGLNVLIEADGGIGDATIAQAAEAGVDVSVAGTAVFKAENPAEVIRRLQAY